MTVTEQKPPFLPPRWFIWLAWRIHRGLYRVTGGRFGLRHPRDEQFGLMRLTATGRRSGAERSVMLAYFEDGPQIITMAMNGWGEAEPSWWLNLQADPEAAISLPGESRLVTARAADADEHERLWSTWIELDSAIDAHAQARSTPTTVVVLEPQIPRLE